MTRRDAERSPGYRGALGPREDRLAKPWILAVIAAFLLVIVLSLAGIPSRFTPDPTPIPLPSIVVPSPSESRSPDASASAEGSVEASVSAQPSPTSE